MREADRRYFPVIAGGLAAGVRAGSEVRVGHLAGRFGPIPATEGV